MEEDNRGVSADAPSLARHTSKEEEEEKVEILNNAESSSTSSDLNTTTTTTVATSAVAPPPVISDEDLSTALRVIKSVTGTEDLKRARFMNLRIACGKLVKSVPEKTSRERKQERRSRKRKERALDTELRKQTKLRKKRDEAKRISQGVLVRIYDQICRCCCDGSDGWGCGWIAMVVVVVVVVMVEVVGVVMVVVVMAVMVVMVVMVVMDTLVVICLPHY